MSDPVFETTDDGIEAVQVKINVVEMLHRLTRNGDVIIARDCEGVTAILVRGKERLAEFQAEHADGLDPIVEALHGLYNKRKP